MSQEIDSLRDIWWNKYQSRQTEGLIEYDDKAKLELIKVVYDGLYSELRDIHSRQQQVVTWSFTILSGGGFLISTNTEAINIVSGTLISLMLGLFTYALTRTLQLLSEDRMSIARQLDRVHQVMKVFDEDFYVQGTSLFDPIWYGWGFNKENDANWNLVHMYQTLLWIVFGVDVLLMINASGVFYSLVSS